MATIADLITKRADDPSTALLFEDESWSYAELADEAATRASLLASVPGLEPPHIGVLLDNVPEFVFWMAAAALSRGLTIETRLRSSSKFEYRPPRSTRCQTQRFGTLRNWVAGSARALTGHRVARAGRRH